MKRRSAIRIMGALIGLVRPLVHFMVLAVLLGVLGNLAATFIPILGSLFVLEVLPMQTRWLLILIALALGRGFLRYGEQQCNHYIAFKLLALIRDQVFTCLCRLCPAKLEGKERGNLITMITSDIELLEVFYAHTISPIFIAILTTLVMLLWLAGLHPVFAMIGLAGYVMVGLVIPLVSSHFGKTIGMISRERSGALSSYWLDSLRGLSEVLQFGQGAKRLTVMEEKTNELDGYQKRLKAIEGSITGWSGLMVTFFSILILWAGFTLHLAPTATIIAFVSLISSFGPTLALSNLANNLFNTLAAGERVLSLLEETPSVQENATGNALEHNGIAISDLQFAYANEVILDHVNVNIGQNQVIGICGKSGSGKSTLLKLCMRFWDRQSGKLEVGGQSIETLATHDLRAHESFVTQSTDLFHDTIENNIRIAKLDATHEEIVAAAKKAAIHDFIMSLPEGYETMVSELGSSLSGGQKQRLSLARAFLHDGDILLLDEPTSNIDSLNEGIILKALKENSQHKTILLVSHRQSTLGIVDHIYQMDEGRLS